MHDCSSDVPAHDTLSEVLQDLRIGEGSYARCELGAPWGITFPAQLQARFHFVVAGQCALRAGEGRWRMLRAGDIALLPHGTGHVLASKPRANAKSVDAMPLEEIGDDVYRMRAGGTGAKTVLVCCSVTFAEPGMRPLLDLMPRTLMLRGGAERDPMLTAILDAMSKEVLGQRMGAATVMIRLADVLITSAVRSWAESRREDSRGWLAAIRDPRISRAIAAIHQKPGDPWSLEALSRVAQTSRSVFAERFVALVGVSPGRYLTQWRMRLACEWLRTDRATVAEAATRLGYESEAAFSRAFKRFAGRPPSAVRREGRDAARGSAVATAKAS